MTIDKNDNYENEFMRIGLISFFNSEDDKNVNWKDFFDLREEEQFYSLYNNQIIQDDNNEDKIWRKYI